MKHTEDGYRQLASMPLDGKIIHAQMRIREWYDHYNGQVYVSFSGGKASTVLLHLVRAMYPDVEAVFVDTHTELPEVRQFALSVEPLTVLCPKRDFRQIISEQGYPIVSNRVARIVRYAQQGKPWALNWIDNKFASGDERKTMRMKKWKFLVDAPFKVSDICCDVMKHQPIRSWERVSGKKPYIGLQASESHERMNSWKQHGCNSYDTATASSNPLSIWTDEDIWSYIRREGLLYCKVYDMGYERTGCAFCGFGAHIEKMPNRFQRMKETHPALYQYCMKPLGEGGLGLGEVLEYIGVEH